MYKEVAVENFSDIPLMVMSGANRIELNDNLAVGGTTPSLGIVQETSKYLQEKGIPLVEMIRPRGGNFVYNDIELKMMEADLFQAQKLGIDAVTFGALTKDGDIDEEAMELLIGSSYGMQIVFHMAFDAIPLEKQFHAIDWLIENNVDRILTHGGALDIPIENTIDHLKEIIEYAAGRIEILPGGGINYDNCDDIAKELNVNALHGTQIINPK
ncbi:copper homeostasis protein CutC [Lactobacillus terrae]|uniref:copper homeostasis protein CutC n=1 Tax=Lactobacillus terrae TaxID=2269374 RepID=UPI000C1B616A|nr:copper homeostasis protein CutC [Lactobacillus terrae]